MKKILLKELKSNQEFSFIQATEINLDTEKIIQDDEEFEVAVFTRDTRIKDVRHSLVPIEYPETSEEGIAYIYHIENWADPKAAFHDVSFEHGWQDILQNLK